MLFPNGFNDELSRSIYKGVLACQRPEVFTVFDCFIQNIKPSLIVEIGTCYGGLAWALHDSGLQAGSKLITYDILERDSLTDLRNAGVDVRLEDIYTKDYQLKSKAISEFNSYPSPRLFLADGGNKIAEFAAFISLAKSGDFIGAHDFAYSDLDFRNSSIWGWAEIQEKDIQKWLYSSKLNYYAMDQFRSIAWVMTQVI